MPSESKSVSVKAIKLARAVLEAVQGDLGLLRFNIDELTPTNGVNGSDSQKWKLICSFYESLSSSSPSKYEVNVDLNDNTVRIKKLSNKEEREMQYKVTPEPTESIMSEETKT